MPSEQALHAHLQTLIEQWLRADKSRTARELARLAGITPTHISTIRSGNRGVGMKALRGLARALNTTIAQLEEEAEALERLRPEQFRQEPHVETDDRYPNFAAAAAWARARGRLPAAIEAVRATGLKGEDLSPDEWSSKIDSAHSDLRRGVKPAGVPVPMSDNLKPSIDWVPEHLRKPKK